MNISDEYFTDEAPTEPGLYAVKRPDGSWFTYDQSDHRPARNSSLGFRFCCLAPAAEVERLKAENEKLREDFQQAAGELRVPMPEPGTDMARLLSTNVLLRQERDRLRERVKRLEEAGDDMERYIDNGLRLNDVTVAWNIAKEAQP